MERWAFASTEQAKKRMEQQTARIQRASDKTKVLTNSTTPIQTTYKPAEAALKRTASAGVLYLSST
jgi:hypothetical protein